MTAASAELDQGEHRVVESVLPVIEQMSGAASQSSAGRPAAALFAGRRRFALAIEQWSDRRMLAGAAELDMTGMRVPQKMTAVLVSRLEGLRAFPHSATSFRRNLGPVARLRAAYGTADATWRAIGDRSTGFNAFTKRATLAVAFAPVPDFWLNSGGDKPATIAFLQSRLTGATKLFAPIRRVQSWFSTSVETPRKTTRQ